MTEQVAQPTLFQKFLEDPAGVALDALADLTSGKAFEGPKAVVQAVNGDEGDARAERPNSSKTGEGGQQLPSITVNVGDLFRRAKSKPGKQPAVKPGKQPVPVEPPAEEAPGEGAGA